jgi:hypothetical protein
MIPRFLSPEAAATYCGMSPNLFEEHLAPAAPSVRVGNRNLWDVRALDRRLDQQSGLAQATRLDDEWAGSRAACRKRTGPGRLNNAVVGAATDGIKVGIALGIYSALRKGDVIRFRWSSYDGSTIRWTLVRFGVVLGHRSEATARAARKVLETVAPEGDASALPPPPRGMDPAVAAVFMRRKGAATGNDALRQLTAEENQSPTALTIKILAWRRYCCPLHMTAF